MDQGTPPPPDMRAAPQADWTLLDNHGVTFVEVGDGRATIRAVAEEHMVNARGFVHGGVAFVLADTACAYALRSTGAPGVTQNAAISYLMGTKAGMELEAVAEIVKAGARIVSLRAEVRTGDTMVAHGQFTFVRQPK